MNIAQKIREAIPPEALEREDRLRRMYPTKFAGYRGIIRNAYHSNVGLRGCTGRVLRPCIQPNAVQPHISLCALPKGHASELHDSVVTCAQAHYKKGPATITFTFPEGDAVIA